MKKRMLLCGLLGLLIISLVACGGGYQAGTMGEVFENGVWTYKQGYSGNWYAEIHANGEWYGNFSGGGNGLNTGMRTLKGVGDAVVYLPDNADGRFAMVGQTGDNGGFTLQIKGPDYEGDLMSGQGKMEISVRQEADELK